MALTEGEVRERLTKSLGGHFGMHESFSHIINAIIFAASSLYPANVVGSLAATCIVVASDASAKMKVWAATLQAAGYPVWVCDGTADDVQIQAAIDALTAERTNVETVRAFGSFVFADKISVPSYTELDFTGANITGPGGTVYNLIKNSDRIDGNTEIHIKGLALDGSFVAGASVGDGGLIDLYKCTNFTIDDVEVKNGYNQNIELSQ